MGKEKNEQRQTSLNFSKFGEKSKLVEKYFVLVDVFFMFGDF
jgi:hypothetical protein